jgi:predicted transcriptional regulator
VKYKARKVGITRKRSRPWLPHEIALLKRLYPKNNQQNIADKLGRSVSAVQKKAGKLGLTENPCVWSKEELNLLKKQYPNKTAQEIANQLGRPVQATRFKIVKLGLRKRRLAE